MMISFGTFVKNHSSHRLALHTILIFHLLPFVDDWMKMAYFILFRPIKPNSRKSRKIDGLNFVKRTMASTLILLFFRMKKHSNRVTTELRVCGVQRMSGIIHYTFKTNLFPDELHVVYGDSLQEEVLVNYHKLRHIWIVKNIPQFLKKFFCRRLIECTEPVQVNYIPTRQCTNAYLLFYTAMVCESPWNNSYGMAREKSRFESNWKCVGKNGLELARRRFCKSKWNICGGRGKMEFNSRNGIYYTSVWFNAQTTKRSYQQWWQFLQILAYHQFFLLLLWCCSLFCLNSYTFCHF